MISFENTEIAFQDKPTKDLKRAYWLFKIVASPTMVKVGKWLTNVSLKLHLPIKGIVKATIFKQFCGGESINESLIKSKELANRGVHTILDYSIEGKTRDEDFDKTVNEIISTIEQAKTNKDIPFAVFKVTGICRSETLEQTNDSCDNLSEPVLNDYNQLIERIDRICCAAHEANVPVFIDAEETWIQNTIDRLTRIMSLKYNKEKAIVFNTAQLYRHDRLAFLEGEIEDARKEGYFLGMKLVRGAYMEKERERAELNGYPSPIQPDKEATDRDFDKAIKVCLANIDIVSFCAGTHNEKSSDFLASQMAEMNLSSKDERIYFAQLLGMSDHISFNLSHLNYNVAKYVPYGPIREVMPYLIRRAEENTSVAGQTTRELSLIITERKRRKALK